MYLRGYRAQSGQVRRAGDLGIVIFCPCRIVVVAVPGLAGLRTVEELRARGYGGQITLVGAETRPPYDRPPLSKKLMTGELDDTSLRADLDSLGARVLLGHTATQLRPGVLTTDAGEHDFDALVLATGATPVRLPGPGPQHVLRTMDEALALRALLRPGTTLCVVGAGWIGAELATAATKRGSQVTVLEAAETPLAAAVGPEVGAITAGWYAEAGVDLRLGQKVGSIEAGGVALAGGEWLAADVVVTAIGVRPEVGWLAGSGIELENGIAVDARLRTSMPGVYAAGDCASFWSGALPQAPAVRALGRRAACPRGRGGRHSGRQFRLRPRSLLLVRAVRADGAVRGLARGSRPDDLAGRAGSRAEMGSRLALRRAPRGHADRQLTAGSPAGQEAH